MTVALGLSAALFWAINNLVAVRITRTQECVDALLGHLVLEIEWAPADALPLALCLSARLPAPDCERIVDVSVVRGNVILVDHGHRVRPGGPFGRLPDRRGG